MIPITLFWPPIVGSNEHYFFNFLLGPRSRTQVHFLLQEKTLYRPLLSLNLSRAGDEAVRVGAFWPQARFVGYAGLDRAGQVTNNESTRTLLKIRYTCVTLLGLSSARLYLPEEDELFCPENQVWIPTRQIGEVHL